jgi:hypothetical protein
MEMERRWENKKRDDRYQEMERREIRRDEERRMRDLGTDILDGRR